MNEKELDKGPFLSRIENLIDRENKKLLALEKTQKEAESWPHEQHLLELLKSQLHLIKKRENSVKIHDPETCKEHTIEIDARLTPQDNLKKQAKKVKKFKLALDNTQRLLQETKTQIRHLQNLKNQLLNASTPEELHLVISQLSPKPQKVTTITPAGKKAHPFWEFKTASGATIFAGKKATDNDTLSLSFANGNDTWMHVAGYPGSHVIIRLPQGQELDQESLQDAYQVAIHYSKGKERIENEITVTQAKYVSKTKNAPAGQVMVSKRHHVTIRKDPARFTRLKERSSQ